MGRKGTGVEVRDNSIRVNFMWNGSRQRETLMTNGEPMRPTQANIKFAERLMADVNQSIRLGKFNYGEHFPNSRHASTGEVQTIGMRLDDWLAGLVDKAPSTLRGYQKAVNWWKKQIGSKNILALVHSDIVRALASEPGWTGKTRNNKVSPLRQMLEVAMRDGLLTKNPLEGLKAAKHQKPAPDPFSLEEAEMIIKGMETFYGKQVANYWAFKFFSGVRTSESIALAWKNVDFRRKVIAVDSAVVEGKFKASTKTNAMRLVRLNSRAMAILQDQRAHTQMLPHGFIFVQPHTKQRWTSDKNPRENFWNPCLKRLGIRHRGPYNTRHTYATMMLMSGMTSAFAARQMGHSIEMFHRIYTRWLDGHTNEVELGLLEGFLAGQVTPQLPAIGDEPARASGKP
jgi:integrase